jgi:hypothetical protein
MLYIAQVGGYNACMRTMIHVIDRRPGLIAHAVLGAGGFMSMASGWACS